MNIYRPRVNSRMDGVFYWIMPGQMWVTDSLHIRYDSQGLEYAFAPWLGFADPFEDLEFNEGSGIESCIEVVSCSDCGITKRQVQTIQFTMSNDIAQPFASGVGLSFMHRDAKSIIETCGIRGFRFIANSKQSSRNQDLDYSFVDCQGEVFPASGDRDAKKSICEHCSTAILACESCGRISTACPNCRTAIDVSEIVNHYIDGKKANGQDWPVRLSTWNLDDAVGGAYWFCVTGALLEALISKDITPFAFGPIETECYGASHQQLEKATEVARNFQSLKQLLSKRA